MLANEYKLYVSIQKSSKDAKFGECLYPWGSPFIMSRTDAQNGVEIIFNGKHLASFWYPSLLYTFPFFAHTHVFSIDSPLTPHLNPLVQHNIASSFGIAIIQI